MMYPPCGIFNRSLEQDVAIVRTKLQWVLLALALIAAFTFPLYAGLEFVNLAIYVGILIIIILGLNITSGYAGQISVGHAAFAAVGAYSAGILVNNGLSFWLAIPCAGIITAVVGMFFGAPSLRLKGFYLAMATLAAYFIISWIIGHWSAVTGGASGLTIEKPRIGDIVFDTDLSYFYVMLVFLVIMTFFSVNLMRTKAGRAFVALRDNDLAAEVMGINLTAYKLLAFGIGCFFAGIGGALLIGWYGHISPETFTQWDSFWWLGVIVVGGLGSNLGVILGTIFIYGIDHALVNSVTYISSMFPQLEAFVMPGRGMLFGLIVILFLIFEPRGINHLWNLFKSAYRLYPFAY